MSDRADTKYGHLLSDEDLEDPEPETDEPSRPIVDVSRHMIFVDDNRDSHGYEHGLEWTFLIDGGQITGVGCGHYLEGRTQADPMARGWDDVPETVRLSLENELNVDDIDAIVDHDSPGVQSR